MAPDMDPGSVAEFAANFSSMPRMAPPPLGNLTEGGVIRKEFSGDLPDELLALVAAC